MPASAHEELIIRHFSGSISPQEQEALTNWLKESPEHQKAFDDYERVWKLSSPKATPPDFQTGQEWLRLEHTLDSMDQQEKPLYGSSWGKLKIAASIILLLGSAALLFLLNRADELVIAETGGEEIHLTLADGSEVWLNRDSRLSYPENFEGDERLVKLSGEAFFKVAHNPAKPFIVLADKAKVKVLGTSFNVKAPEQAPVAQVFVLSGKVSLSATEAEEEQVILQPGQKGILMKAHNSVRMLQEENSNVLAWKENKLVFKKATLGEVISTLEDYFDIRMQVSEPELLNCRFTGVFREPALAEVLEVLRHSLNISISTEGNTYKLEGEGCKAKDV